MSSDSLNPLPAQEQQHKYFPNTDLKITNEFEYKFKVKNFSKQTKFYSNPYKGRWRVLMFPEGNNVSEFVSLYLDYEAPGSDSSKYKLPDNSSILDNETISETSSYDNKDMKHVCAYFAIRLANCKDDEITVFKEAKHRFSANESDWGFTQFVKRNDLVTQGLLEDDELYVFVYIRIVEDELGTLWHNFMNWDSKEETGYVGLKNQGATCYMNSLLQSLYFTKWFRKSVYEIPTVEDDPTKSVALALQRVFYQLSTSTDAVDTRELTKSFGWDTLDAFMQHDVQEFNRVLQDNLENKMKSTKAEGALEKLFVGKMKSYIKCINVDYESSRVETFYDIQLNVKGKANLQESFDDYICVEMLDGDNKYQSEKYGLQDAKKGVIFTEMPPVLHLQLKRFEYDFERDRMVKINDYHEYPPSIDLSKYVEGASPGQHVYELFGVLVHSGDVNAGHYRAFLRPTIENKWFNFDDDRVTPVALKEVFDDNFGASSASNVPAPTNNLQQKRQLIKRFTNAYMLVYMKQRDLELILNCEENIPPHVRNALEIEEKKREEEVKIEQEKHFYLNVLIVRESLLLNQVIDAFDLSTFTSNTLKIRAKKTDLWKEFKLKLAEQLQSPLDKLRIWNFCKRQNLSVRPDLPIPPKADDEEIEGIWRLYSKNWPEIKLFIEEKPEFPVVDNHNVLVHIKYFDPKRRQLIYAGSLVINLNMKANVVEPLIRTLVSTNFSLELNEPLKLFEEIKNMNVELLKTRGIFSDNEIMSGDIIVACPESLVSTGSFIESEFSLGKDNGMMEYYDYLHYKVLVQFRTKKDDKLIVECWLNRKISYESMAKVVYDRMVQTPKAGNDDHLKISFQANPKGANDYKKKQTLNEIINSNYFGNIQVPTLWVEVLEYRLAEYENLIFLDNVVGIDQHGRERELFELMINKESTVADLLQKLREKFHSAFKISDPRLLIVSGRTTTVLGQTENIRQYYNKVPIFFVELEYFEISPTVSTGITLANVLNFNKELNKTHSLPFKIGLRPDLQIKDMKKMLQLKIGKADSQKFKIGLIFANKQGVDECYYLWDGEKFLEKEDAVVINVMKNFVKSIDMIAIGLDHHDRKFGVSSPAGGVVGEKAIKILN